jgi:hypothetical protein
VEVLALTDGGRDFSAKGGGVLCNKRRGHVIRKVVCLTWKKWYKYQKNRGVLVMSTTLSLCWVKLLQNPYISSISLLKQLELGHHSNPSKSLWLRQHTVVDTTHTRDYIPSFSNLNRLLSFSFSVT